MIKGLYNPDDIAYSKKDACISLIIVGVLTFLPFIFLSYSSKLNKVIIEYVNSNIISYLIIRVINILLSFSIILFIVFTARFSKREIAVIGINTKNIGKSLVWGIGGSIPFILINWMAKGFSVSNKPIVILVEAFYYIFAIGFLEEIVYRGYLQQRIEVLFAKKWMSVILGSLVFASSHLLNLLNKKLNIIQIAITIVVIAVMHIVMLFLFRQSRNIIGSSIGHGLIDLFGWI